MSKAVVQVVVLLILVGLLTVAGTEALATRHDATVSNSHDVTTVENESFQPQNDTVIQLSKTDPERVFLGNVTVYQEGNAYTEDSGRYFNYRRDDGSIYIFSNTWLNTSRTADITYSYYEPGGTQRTLFGIGRIGAAASEGVLVGAAALVVIAAFSVVLGGAR